MRYFAAKILDRNPLYLHLSNLNPPCIEVIINNESKLIDKVYKVCNNSHLLINIFQHCVLINIYN